MCDPVAVLGIDSMATEDVLDRVAQDRETSTSPPRLSCPADKRPPAPAPVAAEATTSLNSPLRRGLSSELPATVCTGSWQVPKTIEWAERPAVHGLLFLLTLMLKCPTAGGG